jgi:hypothetical protein
MRLGIFASGVLLLVAFTAEPQEMPRVTGFFSDMRLVPEAGDVLGAEVWIVYARGHYYATIQTAEGEPDPPVVVPAEVNGQRIKFSLTDAAGSVLKFEGTVAREGLTGTVNSKPLRLKRRNSYWQ